jgi:hypothetical protein
MVGVGLAGVLIICLLVVGAWVYYTSNVEQPKYDVVEIDGAIELRDYPKLIVAEVTTEGDRRSSVRSGFRPLANYIFAQEEAGDKIEMTAPVTQQRNKIAMTAPVTQSRSKTAEQQWVIGFIMPSKYTMQTLPSPTNSDVRLTTVPPTRKAAIRFSGVATDALIAEQEKKLKAWLVGRDLTPEGGAIYAYYNDPFTPGPLRRNEVLFDLVSPK